MTSRRSLERRLGDLEKEHGVELTDADLWRAALTGVNPSTGEELDEETHKRIWAGFMSPHRAPEVEPGDGE